MKQDDIADGVIRLFPHEDKIAGFHIGFHAAGQNRRPGEPQQLRRPVPRRETARLNTLKTSSRTSNPVQIARMPAISRFIPAAVYAGTAGGTPPSAPAVMAARRDGSGPPVAGAGPFCSAVISRRMVY